MKYIKTYPIPIEKKAANDIKNDDKEDREIIQKLQEIIHELAALKDATYSIATI
ncbi:hypothetical protein PGH07_07925 [Sulfurovum sp. zt1-1]|uniref:Uncharacterized protein n=1 Tax=Sulfurovum zhangzhouensis TaxID=3019067 RepID=A0ABT7QZ39_9BACT|nr:hypothetical protein [Sulfurovum zhangzhouensis]MDM5272105.1 hypothetical protein [Sulfurovum zhangzhouensis]